MDEATEQRLLARISAYESTAELNPFKERCVRCGRVAAGYAYVGDDRLCHPDDPDRQDCYELEQWGVPRPTLADGERKRVPDTTSAASSKHDDQEPSDG